jgi:hypothetical protein
MRGGQIDPRLPFRHFGGAVLGQIFNQPHLVSPIIIANRREAISCRRSAASRD